MKIVKVVEMVLVAAGLYFLLFGAVEYAGAERIGVMAFGLCLIIIARAEPRS